MYNSTGLEPRPSWEKAIQTEDLLPSMGEFNTNPAYGATRIG